MKEKPDPPLPNWQCNHCGFKDIITGQTQSKCPICGSKKVQKINWRKRVTADEKRLVSFY